MATTVRTWCQLTINIEVSFRQLTTSWPCSGNRTRWCLMQKKNKWFQSSCSPMFNFLTSKVPSGLQSWWQLRRTAANRTTSFPHERPSISPRHEVLFFSFSSFFRNKEVLVFFQISPNCNPRRKIWHFRLDLESICFSLWLLRAFLDGRELQQSQLAQILQLWSFIIIIGYFYGIIHSINGVLLVLITRKGPWQWRYTKTGWWNVNECNMTTCYIVNNRRQKEHWMYTTNDFKNQH